jgi:DNA-binding MarR family transcriptional regulator
MNHQPNDVRLRKLTAVAFLPPAIIEETAWDILLALHSDRQRELSLRKLELLVSVPQRVLDRWLARLEKRGLITGSAHRPTGELTATLTEEGRALLDTYLSATSDLQVGAHL